MAADEEAGVEEAPASARRISACRGAAAARWMAAASSSAASAASSLSLASVVSLAVLFLLGYPTLIEFFGANLPPVVADVLNGVSPFKYFQSIARGVRSRIR